MFYLYVFALTLDLPSASIKCSTYVTSPTTNQIPDDTHQGERSRENNGGLEQKTSRPAGRRQSAQTASPEPSSSTSAAAQYGTGLQKAHLFLKKFKTSYPVLVNSLLKHQKAIAWGQQLFKRPRIYPISKWRSKKNTFYVSNCQNDFKSAIPRPVSWQTWEDLNATLHLAPNTSNGSFATTEPYN